MVKPLTPWPAPPVALKTMEYYLTKDFGRVRILFISDSNEVTFLTDGYECSNSLSVERFRSQVIEQTPELSVDEKVEQWLDCGKYSGHREGFCELSSDQASIILKRVKDLKRAYLELFEQEVDRWENEDEDSEEHRVIPDILCGDGDGSYFYVSGPGFGARVYENKASSAQEALEYVAMSCREAEGWNESMKNAWKVTGPHQ